MKTEDLLFYTDNVPIVDKKGKEVDRIILPEKIKPMPRRRCGFSDAGIYYKGAGIIYTGHFVNECDEYMNIVEETGVLYEKYNVVYPSLYRRYGLFLFQHQPCFSDCEGGCGQKEKNIIKMQEEFELSAIEEILDVINTPIEQHFIYIYRLKNLRCNYKNTLRLIEYILVNNYNTGWDKNVWDDIECFGYVRDLADWFESSLFCHKLGTIYALLSSLAKKDKYLYEMIVRELTGLEQLGDYHIVYISALIVKRYSPNSFPEYMALDEICEDLYIKLYKELYSGKACCHLEDEQKWEYIKDSLIEEISEKVSLAQKDILYFYLTKSRIKR